MDLNENGSNPSMGVVGETMEDMLDSYLSNPPTANTTCLAFLVGFVSCSVLLVVFNRCIGQWNSSKSSKLNTCQVLEISVLLVSSTFAALTCYVATTGELKLESFQGNIPAIKFLSRRLAQLSALFVAIHFHYFCKHNLCSLKCKGGKVWSDRF